HPRGAEVYRRQRQAETLASLVESVAEYRRNRRVGRIGDSRLLSGELPAARAPLDMGRVGGRVAPTPSLGRREAAERGAGRQIRYTALERRGPAKLREHTPAEGGGDRGLPKGGGAGFREGFHRLRELGRRQAVKQLEVATLLYPLPDTRVSLAC